MIGASVARRYAKALLLIGLEDKSIEKIDEELGAFDTVVAGSKELSDVMADPTVLPSSKGQIIKGVVEAMKLSETVTNFILLLAEKGRLTFFHQIRVEHRRLADEQAGRATAVVTSASALGDEMKASLVEKLSKMSGRKVELTQKVDPALLGGMVAEIGGVVYDGSLRTQLRAVRDAAAKG